MATLHYKLITPERVVTEGETPALTVMTETGEITILPNHIPLATLLAPGEMRVKEKGEEKFLAVSGGLLEVLPGNEIVILADEAYAADELNLAAIEEAKKRAEEAVKNAKRTDNVEFASLAANLERELAKYRVAMKRKRS